MSNGTTPISPSFPFSTFYLIIRRTSLPPPIFSSAMPLYEYKCPHCKTTIEKLQTGFTALNIICRKCVAEDKKQIEMKRILSRSSFLLKGDGWYKDHYGLKSATAES
jgi:putative FmdB family regulatory protein